ncbi:MAG: GspH/FimT family pseudopilin [bacterium]
MRLSRRKKNQGFTLVEMLIVLAIMGLVSAIGVYTYLSQIDKINLRNDARALNSALQLAKMRAMSTGFPHGVAFQRGDPDSADNQGKYMVFLDCDGDGEFDDTDANLTNNSPISSPDACSGMNIDPRMEGQSVEQLSKDIYFTTILGSKAPPSGGDLESIVFDFLGHGMQGQSIVTGDILIQNQALQGGKVDSSGVHIVGGTGNTDLILMRRVDKDDWK